MRLLILLVLCIVTTACSGGGSDFGSNPLTQRLLVTTYSPGGTDTQLTLAGPRSSAFSAVTYYIYATNADMGSQSIIPLQVERLDEQAFGPFAFGDAPQDIDLSPWDDFDHIYLRAILVSPNKGWKLIPGKIYEFSTN